MNLGISLYKNIVLAGYVRLPDLHNREDDFSDVIVHLAITGLACSLSQETWPEFQQGIFYRSCAK